MIELETARFGTIQVAEDALFTFPMGMLGFARHKKYVIVDHREDSPFKWLQSVEDGELAFIVTDPLYFKPDYHVRVRKGELSVIGPVAENELVVAVILTVPENPQQMTANLLAPLIFNVGNRKAMQLVLTDRRFPVKYRVMQPGSPGLTLDPTAPEPKSISLR